MFTYNYNYLPISPCPYIYDASNYSVVYVLAYPEYKWISLNHRQTLQGWSLEGPQTIYAKENPRKCSKTYRKQLLDLCNKSGLMVKSYLVIFVSYNLVTPLFLLSTICDKSIYRSRIRFGFVPPDFT